MQGINETVSQAACEGSFGRSARRFWLDVLERPGAKLLKKLIFYRFLMKSV
jgi:hypothetical protein